MSTATPGVSSEQQRVKTEPAWDNATKATANLVDATKDLYNSLGVMIALVDIKYGNLDADVNEEVAKALAARAKARGERT